jgi:methylated-DNA-protein-cysteine methyltransferase-like protein
MKTKRAVTLESSSFTQRVKNIIKKIPRGKVATYGQIAALAGNYRAARQVVWTLNSSSRKDKLPWHRVVNSKGQISLKPNCGYEVQKELLQKEGVKFSKSGNIDFKLYLWSPSSLDVRGTKRAPDIQCDNSLQVPGIVRKTS